jgi:hypothetical protein
MHGLVVGGQSSKYYERVSRYRTYNEESISYIPFSPELQYPILGLTDPFMLSLSSSIFHVSSVYQGFDWHLTSPYHIRCIKSLIVKASP